MKLAVLALTVCLCGCDHTPADNDRIIRETKKCHDAGMKAAFDWNGGIMPMEDK